MKSLLIAALTLISLSISAQSTDGKKIDQLVNRVVKDFKKFDTTDIEPFRKMIISDDEIQDFITAMDADEEFKEEIRANITDGMFQNALEASYNDFVEMTKGMEINWKKIEYKDFLYEIRNRDGLKQLRGELYLLEGEKRLQVQVTAALLNGKFVVIELEDLRGGRMGRSAEEEAEEMIREMERAMEEAEEATGEEYEAEEELINRMEEMEEATPLPPPVIIEEKVISDGPVGEEVIDFPDKEAQFPGGTGELQKYIMENVKYPTEALEKGIQGRVYLSFIVEKDGSLSQIKVERGVSEELDREAKRVVRAMPNWEPGEAAGMVVRTRCRLPIAFVLSDK